MATLYIDASDILTGGGKTHLIELLKNGDPQRYGFDKVILFGHQSVSENISDLDWLVKKSPTWIKFGYPGRMMWKTFGRSNHADGMWFVPGAGSAPGNFVTMCQNLLPVDRNERSRYFFSLTWLRLVVLGWLHVKSFKKALGVIFLNNYCIQVLPESVRNQLGKTVIIPHGVSADFKPGPIATGDGNFKLIYVSTIDEYKHQWLIAHAVQDLRAEGHPITIDFIGAANPDSMKKLKPYLSDCIRYHDAVPYAQLPRWYNKADVFIFGSTCETFGMVLLEAMACGLPVLCSNRSSMPETLGANALYFDVLNPDSVKEAILNLFSDKALRLDLKQKGITHSQKFKWSNVANETFSFIQQCGEKKV